jgi:hypothetical protein
LRATFDEYSKIANNDIETAIKKEMSGYLKDALLAIGELIFYFISELNQTDAFLNQQSRQYEIDQRILLSNFTKQ